MSITLQMYKLPMFKNIDRMEDELFAQEDMIHPNEDSPLRFEIMRERLKRGGSGPPKQMIPIMLPTLAGINKSLKSLADNPENPKTNAPPVLIEDIEAFTLQNGASNEGRQ